MSAATAAAHRLGRGRVRIVDDDNALSGLSWGSLARCRACRWAAVIGMVPMRRVGILDLLLCNRDVTLPAGHQTRFLCSTGHSFTSYW